MSRKEYKKVYQGIPKAITDENSIFYASLDGDIDPFESSITPIYKPISTGYGIALQNGMQLSKSLDSNSDVLTVDLIYKHHDNSNNDNSKYIFSISKSGETTFKALRMKGTTNELLLSSYRNNAHINSYVICKLTVGETYFLRLILNKNNADVYVNGIKLKSYSNTLYCNELDTIKIGNTSEGWGALGIYSDLHISNIDRGDYFPNLPQEFIDGKSVIKTRMGQQQIKGDPMYSQTTLLKVLNANNIHSSDYYNIDGYMYYVNSPELKTTGSYSWASSSTITIKSLNNEVISGVIDSNTALCRVVKNGDGTVSKIHTKYVDDTSKIEVGDSLIWCKPGSGTYSNNIGVVLSKTENSFQIEFSNNFADSVTIGDFYVEVTASSSTPIVKTEDDVRVEGTWSGLGTREATFTLGTNSNIVGKDLYVEYALTMPYGNSYFDELPQSIESILNQNSVKLKETTSLTIEDDFLGKSKTNGDPCSFSAYYTTGTDLVDISALNSSIELSASNYYQISESNPLTNISYSTTSTNTRLQVVCKFNIIEMIENKFGKEIPAIDKLAWIKYNLKSLSYSVIASGNGSQSVKIVPYYYSANRWYTDSTVYNGTGYSILSYTNSNTSPNYYANNSIDDDGNTYLIIYTDTISTEGTTVLLNLAYVKISLELNYDTTFKLYFSENRRAREDSCIPMLVQTETKTIKSYLDIKEPLVTEYKYNEFKGVSPASIPEFEDFIYSRDMQLNTMGTGRATESTMGYKSSLANITKSKVYEYSAEYIKDVYKLYGDSSKYTTQSCISYIPRRHTTVNRPYGLLLEDSDVDANNFVVLLPFIVDSNSELRLGLISEFYKNRRYNTTEVYTFPIPNTPLIK